MAGGKFGLLDKLNFEDLYNAFLALDEKKQVLAALGILVLLILLIVVPISCASSKLSNLESEMDKNRQAQNEFAERIAVYQSAKAKLQAEQRTLAQKSGTSLNTLIESLARESSVEVERLNELSMGTNDYFDEKGADIILKPTNLNAVLQFIYSLETSQRVPLKIKKMELKPRPNARELVSATITVSTLVMKGDAGNE